MENLTSIPLEQVQTFLVSTEELYRHAPELPFIFRYLPDMDFSLFQWVINGIPGMDQFAFRSSGDKVELLSEYIFDIWESTKTEMYDIDTAHYGNKISSMASNHNIHARVIEAMIRFLYPILTLPSDSIFIHSFSRIYAQPEFVGEPDHGLQQPIYYAINFSTIQR